MSVKGTGNDKGARLTFFWVMFGLWMLWGLSIIQIEFDGKADFVAWVTGFVFVAFSSFIAPAFLIASWFAKDGE